jgi:hypothetical protein
MSQLASEFRSDGLNDDLHGRHAGGKGDTAAAGNTATS